MDNWMIGLIVALIISAGFAMYHYNKQLASGRHIIARRRADFHNFNPDRYDPTFV
jgi:hypothetical protein